MVSQLFSAGFAEAGITGIENTEEFANFLRIIEKLQYFRNDKSKNLRNRGKLYNINHLF